MTFERTTRNVAIALASAFIVLVLALSILRLAYPYEVEWMEGAMMDHVVRVVHQQPIYTAPTIDFVAWLYPPLYYYAVAAVAKITGVTFLAGRLVSFVSTLLTAFLLGWIVARSTDKRLFGFFAFALYFASYGATGFYFDIVRNDAFFTFLVVLAAWSAIVLPRRASYVTAVILVLAFLTKQQAIFFLPAIALWFWLRNRKSGVICALTSIILILISLLALNLRTHGWANYYMFRIPNAKEADFSTIRMLDVFSNYALSTFAVSSLALIALPVLFKERRSRSPSRTWRAFISTDPGLLLMMAIAGLVAGAFSLGNEGGYKNVMMPFVAFVLPLLPIAVHEIGENHLVFRRYVYIPILFQFIALYFNPLSEKMLIASPHQRLGGDRFMQKLGAIPGEVFIPYHGFIATQAGKPSHAQILASIDVLRMHDSTARRLQAEYDSAYSQHRFSAIVMEESDDFRTDSIAHYTLAGRMLSEPNVYLTRVADDATRPEFIFVPK